MSRWNHAICVDCFTAQQPQREPFALRVVNSETLERVRETHNCCFCGLRTDAGILMRADPIELMCHTADPAVFTVHKEDE